jgi:hypothetical protein
VDIILNKKIMKKKTEFIESIYYLALEM